MFWEERVNSSENSVSQSMTFQKFHKSFKTFLSFRGMASVNTIFVELITIGVVGVYIIFESTLSRRRRVVMARLQIMVFLKIYVDKRLFRDNNHKPLKDSL